MNIIKFTSLESTNQYLKKNYKNLPHKQVIWAKTQTKGQGRKENIWYANKNSLTFSFILKENLQVELINLLPIYIATIIHKVIFKYNN
ncbi:MAG: hypothetical protein K9L64_06850, partial [Candidatus Izimaplasma sp.]|nr:hypothetical protein [Candidatus Izimaplasma bacterium]